MKLDASEVWRLLQEAELICDEDAVDAAVNRVAEEITREIRDSLPLVLSVMGGGVVFTGQLLPRLRFPLEFDYVHVTRSPATYDGICEACHTQPRHHRNTADGGHLPLRQPPSRRSLLSAGPLVRELVERRHDHIHPR